MPAAKKRRVVKKSSGGGTTDTAIVTWFKEFTGLKDQIKTLTAREGEIKGRLKEAVEARGYTDSDGNDWYDLPEEIGGFTKLKRERRVRDVFDRDGALAMVKEKGLKKCVRTIEVIDEDAFAAAVYTGEISEKEFQSLHQQTVTYAFVPRAK